MAREFIYTSVPRGLRPGSSGYCAVVSSPSISNELEEMLARLTEFNLEQPKQTPNVAHVAIRHRDRTESVVFRTTPAGVDYSKRRRKLTHFYLLDKQDLTPAGPGWLTSQPGLFVDDWQDEPQLKKDEARLPTANQAPRRCANWESLTGDAGWGGILVDHVVDLQARPLLIVYPENCSVLDLIKESISLLSVEQRWQATFATNFISVPDQVNCQWRFVPSDSESLPRLLRDHDDSTIDLTKPMNRAPDGPSALAARQGSFVVSRAGVSFPDLRPAVSPFDSVREQVDPQAASSARPATEVIATRDGQSNQATNEPAQSPGVVDAVKQVAVVDAQKNPSLRSPSGSAAPTAGDKSAGTVRSAPPPPPSTSTGSARRQTVGLSLMIVAAAFVGLLAIGGAVALVIVNRMSNDQGEELNQSTAQAQNDANTNDERFPEYQNGRVGDPNRPLKDDEAEAQRRRDEAREARERQNQLAGVESDSQTFLSRLAGYYSLKAILARLDQANQSHEESNNEHIGAQQSSVDAWHSQLAGAFLGERSNADIYRQEKSVHETFLTSIDGQEPIFYPRGQYLVLDLDRHLGQGPANTVSCDLAIAPAELWNNTHLEIRFAQLASSTFLEFDFEIGQTDPNERVWMIYEKRLPILKLALNAIGNDQSYGVLQLTWANDVREDQRSEILRGLEACHLTIVAHHQASDEGDSKVHFDYQLFSPGLLIGSDPFSISYFRESRNCLRQYQIDGASAILNLIYTYEAGPRSPTPNQSLLFDNDLSLSILNGNDRYSFDQAAIRADRFRFRGAPNQIEIGFQAWYLIDDLPHQSSLIGLRNRLREEMTKNEDRQEMWSQFIVGDWLENDLHETRRGLEGRNVVIGEDFFLVGDFENHLGSTFRILLARFPE